MQRWCVTTTRETRPRLVQHGRCDMQGAARTARHGVQHVWCGMYGAAWVRAWISPSDE